MVVHDDTTGTRLVVSVLALGALVNCGGSSSSSGGEPGEAGTGGTPSTGGSAGVGGTGGLVFDGGPTTDGGPGTGATFGSIEAPPLPSCGPPPAPYAGTLCGPADRPCKVLSTEDVSPAKQYYVSAGFALDASNAAHVLMSWSDAPEATVDVRQDNGGWSTENVAGDTRWVAPFAGESGELWTFLFDGSAGTELHRWDGKLWSLVEKVSGFDVYQPDRVQRSTLGCIHAGGSVKSPSSAAYGVREPEGKWTVVPVPGSNPPGLALGPDGRPHLAYWASKGDDKRLFWSTLPGTAEEIAKDGSSGYNGSATPIAVTPDGSVHVAYASYPPGDGQHPMLTYSVRAPNGGWAHYSMATTAAKTKADCGPPAEGAPPCVIDYVEHGLAPTALSSGAGDVRFFVGRARHIGTLAAQCYPPGPGGTGGCSWVGETSVVETGLDLYWLQGSVIEHAPIVEGKTGLLGAAVDANGKIHLAAAVASAATVVTYLVLGP